MLWVLLAAREKATVRERGIGADEHIVFQNDAIRQLDARLYSHTITNADIVFNKDVVAQVTVLADNRSGQINTALRLKILVMEPI